MTLAAPYSYDLRQKVMQAIDNGMKKSEAARVFSLSRNTIDLWLKRRETTGEFEAKAGYQRGSRHKITDWDSFREFAKENGELTQADMAQAWTGEISRHAIGRGLKTINFTRKKKTYGYKERDEQLRQQFRSDLQQKDPETLVYVDESGIDNRDTYDYGWNEKGKRFFAFKEGKRSLRVSIIAALHQEKLLAPLTFEGSCNRQVFEKWLAEQLLPTLSPGQTIILDNATFHKADKIKELIQNAKCELKYLPPYSPDLNEIEHQWFPIKNRVRKMTPSSESFREKVDLAVAASS
jgi:transposase